jgi:hypothetical protein
LPHPSTGPWGSGVDGAAGAGAGADCDTARAAYDSKSTNEIAVIIAGDRLATLQSSSAPTIAVNPRKWYPLTKQAA